MQEVPFGHKEYLIYNIFVYLYQILHTVSSFYLVRQSHNYKLK
jgi:hypothetical protein